MKIILEISAKTNSDLHKAIKDFSKIMYTHVDVYSGGGWGYTLGEPPMDSPDDIEYYYELFL